MQREAQEVGVSRALSGVRANAAEEAEVSTKPFTGVAATADFKWHATPWEILVALSARLHRHPLPTWFIAQYRLHVGDEAPAKLRDQG